MEEGKVSGEGSANVKLYDLHQLLLSYFHAYVILRLLNFINFLKGKFLWTLSLRISFPLKKKLHNS